MSGTETKIAEMDKYKKVLDDIASKISRPSVGSVEDGLLTEASQQRPQRDDYNVVISSTDTNVDVEELKLEIKHKCKENVDLPKPKDVVLTKNKQIIL